MLFLVLDVLSPCPEKSNQIEEIPILASSHAIGTNLSLLDCPAQWSNTHDGLVFTSDET
jgi:hypothetical protein